MTGVWKAVQHFGFQAAAIQKHKPASHITIKRETGATASMPWRRLPAGIDLMPIIKPAGLEPIFAMVIKKAGHTA